jgi:nucleotide-binding universal stress UspA family protein
MNHMRILVPVSHAGGHDAAFERALALARTTGAELYLIHAVPADVPFSFRGAERLARWAGLRDRAAAAGVTVETAEQHGDPARVIVLHADSRAVDLIVMTTERRTGWDRIRQPSVAERVIRRTTRPTLVLRQDGRDPVAFRNVLVAVDPSPASRTIVDTATRLSGRNTGKLTVVHVPVAAGPAVETILAHAAAVEADLIVVGMSRRFMRVGATALRLLRHTDHPVLVVPPTASNAALTRVAA